MAGLVCGGRCVTLAAAIAELADALREVAAEMRAARGPAPARERRTLPKPTPESHRIAREALRRSGVEPR